MLLIWSILFVSLRILEAFVSLSLGFFVVVPALLVLWLLNSGLRFFVTLRLNSDQSKSVRLTRNGLDNIWGYKAPGNSRTVLNVVIYEGQIEVNEYRELFQKKVIECCSAKGQFIYKKLRERFTEYLGFYCWEEDSNFDIRNHVIAYDCKGVMEEKGLMALLGTLSADMSSDHPQWQEVIVPSFKYNPSDAEEPVKSIRILRFHHSYGDAGSWLLLYSHCMADGEIPYAVNPLKGYPIPRWQKYLYYTSAITFGTTTFIRNLWYGANVRPNRLHTSNYAGQKYFAWKKIPLTTLKNVKEQTRTSIPTVITSAIAAALVRFDAKFPLDSGSIIGDATDCGAVAAILPYPGLHLTNRFTIANLTIHTSRSVSRKGRLLLTHNALLALTKSPEPILNYWAMSFFGLFPIAVQNLAMKCAGTALVFSNLPGSSQTFSLHGQKIECGGAWIPLLTTAGLTLSAAGYRNYVRFCGATDSAAMTEKQLNFLLETIVEEVKELEWETGGNTNGI